MAKIVTFTINPSVDKSASVPNVSADEKLRCDTPFFEAGGGGINVSRAIRKLGGESEAYYASGGPTGEMLEFLLTKEEINHHPIHIKGWTRENLAIYEKNTGHQYRFGMPGPKFNSSEWQACLDQMSQSSSSADYLVASGSLPQSVPDDFYARLAKNLKGGKAKFILDTSGTALSLALKVGVYLAKPNLREFGLLAGRQFEDEVKLRETAQRFIEEETCEVLVISLGGAGVLLATKRGQQRFMTPTVPIVSRVGAGDSMVAGTTLGLARNLTVEEAVQFGVAASASTVMTPGSELCRREDAEKLFEQIKKESSKSLSSLS
jgi:6-phosphofructokinase 2